MSYSQLVADLAGHPSIFAVLIHEYDDLMQEKAEKIEVSHVLANQIGTKAFMVDGLNHVDGQASLCYWPYDCRTKDLCQ